MASQFDTEGQYFAQITADGILKIWNTASNSLEQEYVPDVHLASPCTCLQFVECLESSTKNGASPKNKRRKIKNSSLEIVLGTTSGKLLIFSISKGDIKCTIDGNVNLPVSCLSANCGEIIYSGIDENVVAWNIRQRNIASKWKAGNECISAILAITSLKRLLTASKSIKLWNIENQTLLKIFKGHSSDVNILHSVPSYDSIESSYVISGSKSDRLLNCWNVSDAVTGTHASASLLLTDYVTNISLNTNEDGATKLSVSIANGAVHIFQVVFNGVCTKPIKPKTTIRVVADTGQKKDIVPISIVSSYLRNENTILLAHGSSVVLTFEELELNNKKLICLTRQHPHMQKPNEIQTDKVITPLVGNNTTYVTPFSNVAAVTKRKLDNAREVAMEKRLENLSFNHEDGPVPRSNNMAHLLLQGLRSKDKNIIKTVMLTTNEQMVRNTIKRLPINVIYELVEQIGVFMQGNNHIQARAAAVWLKHLLETHAALFISNPDLPVVFATIRNYAASRLATVNEKGMFGAKLNLILSEQMKVASETDESDEDEALVFNDRDTSSESEAESMDTNENEDLDEDIDDMDENELSD